MNKYIFWGMVLAVFATSNLAGQTQNDGRKPWYKQLRTAPVHEVKEGKHLEVARLLSADRFMNYYVANGKRMFGKKYGETIVEVFYKDATYTYAGTSVPGCDFLINLYKVPTSDIPGIDLNMLDGNEIRRRFVSEIIGEDRQGVIDERKKCKVCWDNYLYSYKYLPESADLEILCRRNNKFECWLTYRKIKRRYAAKYNLQSQQLTKCNESDLQLRKE
jgi:hypothetical protein